MSVALVSELNTFMNQTLDAVQAQTALDVAESLLATQVLRLERPDDGINRVANYTTRVMVGKDSPVLYLNAGPLVTLNSFTVNGTAGTVGWPTGVDVVTPWAIGYQQGTDVSNLEFNRGDRIDLDVELGWVSTGGSPGTPIPPTVLNAVLIQAAGIYSNFSAFTTGQTITSERIGDYAVSYNVTSETGASVNVNQVAEAMLRPWARPPFLGA